MTDAKLPAPSQNNSAPDTATLILPGNMKYVFPVRRDSIGDWVHIDADKGILYDENGLPVPDTNPLKKFAAAKVTVFSEGMLKHSSARSEITYIDGDQGVLLYRGYDIQDLASKSSYMEVCYLLLNGELPNKDQLIEFESDVVKRMAPPEQLIKTLDSQMRTAHPMSIMMSLTASLSAYLDSKIDMSTKEGRYEAALELIAKSATIGAMANRYTLNQSIVKPNKKLGFTANYMRMLFADADGDYDLNPVLIQAMDRNLILHADHEQNASTSTVRLSGSAGTTPFAAIAAGIGTLWGPAHGGANEAVLKMLQEIGSVDKIPEFIERVKSKGADATRLMGFGHRVYKNFDPRAKIIKQACDEVLTDLGVKNPLLDVARELERVALNDQYFKDKKLYPNVDFYSGIILSALGLQPQAFTTVFAVGRTVGWIAQANEQADAGQLKIGRPRQHYDGHTQRAFVSMEQRGPSGNDARSTLTAVAAPKASADAK